MFTPSDLSNLLSADPAVGVSIFLPTHVRGVEVRQGPIRLKNLTSTATEQLAAAGIPAGRAETLLAPAAALVEDYRFWQHQRLGLAVFLSDDEYHILSVPTDLAERVVGRGYHVTPLLRCWPRTARSELCHSPPFRTGSSGVHASVWSPNREPPCPDSLPPPPSPTTSTRSRPPRWRDRTPARSASATHRFLRGEPGRVTRQLMELVQKIATAVDALSSRHPLPVVVAADAELGGHFRAATGLESLLIDVVEVNPASLADDDLHAVAYPPSGPSSTPTGGRRSTGSPFRRAAETHGRSTTGRPWSRPPLRVRSSPCCSG